MFYNKLEALRGIFAVLIILAHSPFHLTGKEFQTSLNAYLIVDCFFILSGWTMSLGYQEKISNGMGLIKYLYVRLARFYPVHIFMIILWSIYCFIYWPDEYLTINIVDKYLNGFFLNTLLLQNFINYSPKINYPAWTVSAEFFMYIIFFLSTKYIDKKHSILFPLIISIIFYSYLFYLPGVSINGAESIGFYRCIAGFYLGVSLYRFGDKYDLSKISGNLIEISIVVILYFSIMFGDQFTFAIIISLLMFLLLVIVCTNKNSGIIGWFFERKIFLFLGAISYSIYINHMLVIKLLSPYFVLNGGVYYAAQVNIIFIIFTLLLSMLTFYLIEKPCRKKSKYLFDFFKLKIDGFFDKRSISNS